MNIAIAAAMLAATTSVSGPEIVMEMNAVAAIHECLPPVNEEPGVVCFKIGAEKFAIQNYYEPVERTMPVTVSLCRHNDYDTYTVCGARHQSQSQNEIEIKIER